MGSALSVGEEGGRLDWTIDCLLYFLYFYWFSYLRCSYAAAGISARVRGRVKGRGGEWEGFTVTMHSYCRTNVKLSIFIALLTDISDLSSSCRTYSSLTA